MDLRKFFSVQFQLKKLENNYSDEELKQYSPQDRQFIEYLQIMYNTDKENAIRKYNIYDKDLKENEERRKDFQDELKNMYENVLQFANNPTQLRKQIKIQGIEKNLVFLQEFDKSGYKNALRGIPQSKKAVERFKLLDKKSRRYLDTSTGEEVSKRKRDNIVRTLSIEDYKNAIKEGRLI